MLGDAVELRAVIEPEIESMGFELVLVQLTTGGNRTLRLFIDAPGGITLDDCATVSRRLDPLLDVEDLVQGDYALEVSSPGIDRPLVKPEHFRKNSSQSRLKNHQIVQQVTMATYLRKHVKQMFQ